MYSIFNERTKARPPHGGSGGIVPSPRKGVNPLFDGLFWGVYGRAIQGDRPKQREVHMGLRFPLLLDGETATSLQAGDVVKFDRLGMYTFERGGKPLSVKRDYDAPIEQSWEPDVQPSIPCPEAPIDVALPNNLYLRETGDEVKGKQWLIEPRNLRFA